MDNTLSSKERHLKPSLALYIYIYSPDVHVCYNVVYIDLAVKLYLNAFVYLSMYLNTFAYIHLQFIVR